MKQRKRIERKTMEVEGGTAWVETVRFAKRKPMRTKWLQTDLDGVIRRKTRIVFMKGTVTGDCPECHQMPCDHTAKLLGWPEK